MINNFEPEADLLTYDPTSEQVQNWHYHRKLDEHQPHQLITLEALMKDPDLKAIEQSIEVMVRRHESLRTYFPLVEGDIRQCVAPYSAGLFAPRYFDMSDSPACEQQISRELAACASLLKTLSAPPLMRSCIFRKPGGYYHLYLLVHHIISDEWSKSVMFRELNLLYECFRSGNPVNMQPLGMQLRDYASWQKQWLRENGDTVRKYWADKLGVFTGSYCFEGIYEKYKEHAERSEGCRQGIARSKEELLFILDNGKAASYGYNIDKLLYARLIDLSTRYKVSIGAIINASLQLLFAFLTAKENVLLAIPVINRHIPGTESLIGCLGGGVYLYQPIQQAKPLIGFVKAVYIEFLESTRYLIYDHDEMHVDGQSLRAHCDVFVNFLGKGIIGASKFQLDANAGHRPLKGAEYYALTYSGSEYQDGLSCNWKYNLELYSPEIITFMVAKHGSILQTLARNPEMAICELMNNLQEDKDDERHS